MNLDNRRLQNIQRGKSVIKKKIETETDTAELELFIEQYKFLSKQEKQILEHYDVKK